MYSSVVTVVPHEDFTLAIVFEDGVEGVLDMKPFLDFGVFQRIRSWDCFKGVRVAFGAIEWNGGVDLDPEFVRTKCTIAANT